MKLLVVSHKTCWEDEHSSTGYSSDGGFPFQMAALSELFERTTLCLPRTIHHQNVGAVPLQGHNLSVVPLSTPLGRGIWRKLGMPLWVSRSCLTLIREMRVADAIHAPIPGDVGTIGMLLAYLMRKPLFVRHCGNWFVQTTAAEHFWKWFMEKFAGGRNVMLATGGANEPPSRLNPNLRWIFSTSLTDRELRDAAPREKTLNSKVRLIIICRQEVEKGTGVVIESLPLIKQQFPHATLDVVGDGEALHKFKDLAKTLGLNEEITFHGKVDHEGVCSLLQKADVFCYPTTSSEGFPKVVVEALAHGLPVVTTMVSVLPSLIGSGCGTLIENPQSDDLARAVTDILMDQTRYLEMSAKAVSTARQYSLEHWRDTIGDLLYAAWGRQLSSDARS